MTTDEQRAAFEADYATYHQRRFNEPYDATNSTHQAFRQIWLDGVAYGENKK